MSEIEPVAWVDPEEYDKAASGGQSFNGWRRKYPNTTIPVYSRSTIDALQAALRAKDERIRDLEAALREARPYVKRHEYEPWRNAADQAAGELVSRIDALLGDKP